MKKNIKIMSDVVNHPSDYRQRFGMRVQRSPPEVILAGTWGFFHSFVLIIIIIIECSAQNVMSLTNEIGDVSWADDKAMWIPPWPV